MIDIIRDQGWRQGSIFGVEAHERLAEYAPRKLGRDDCCIVITQSCDIVSDDFELEPIVEIILARKLDSPTDGNFTHARSARRLHLQVTVGKRELGYEALIRDRFNVPRPLLADFGPDTDRALPDIDYNDLIAWIVARYRRDAFPDAFNERVRVAIEQRIKPILKKSPKIKALYLNLNTWDELSRATAYRADILITLNAEDYEDVTVRQTVEKAAMNIEAALSGCEGIAVDEARVASEKDVSLDMLRYYGRWNFDYLSLKEPAKHVQPPPANVGAKPRT